MRPYILSPNIFDCLKRTEKGRGGEVQLTDALKLPIQKEPVHAQRLDARRLDVGSKLEWLKANVEVALVDRNVGPELRKFLKTMK